MIDRLIGFVVRFSVGDGKDLFFFFFLVLWEQGRFTDERRAPNQMDMGTPSAPPIGDIGRHSLETEGEQWRGEAQEGKDHTISAPTMQHSRHGSSGVEEERESLGTSVEGDLHSQKMNQMSSR